MLSKFVDKECLRGKTLSHRKKLVPQNFVKLSTAYTLPFALAHKHIAFMLESAPLFAPPNVFSPDATVPPKSIPITRAARPHYHSLVSMAGVLDFFQDECDIDLFETNGAVVDPWSPRR